MQNKINKFLAAILAFVILYASFGGVISYAADAILEASKMEQQGVKTNNNDVSFDAYYGDPSPLVLKMSDLKKTVMIRSADSEE